LNQYTGITDCYDLLMRGGYYDHDTMAGAADAVMGDRKKVLELGVGTGCSRRAWPVESRTATSLESISRRPCWKSRKTGSALTPG